MLPAALVNMKITDLQSHIQVQNSLRRHGWYGEFPVLIHLHAYPEITGLDVTDAQTSELTISVDNLQVGANYILTVRDEYSFGRILYQSIVNSASEPFVINLMLNGLTVPITSLNISEFYV